MIDINKENKKLCTGCEACVQICPQTCIQMESDEEGFLYPKVNRDLCIKCGLCNKVCSIENELIIDNYFDKPKVYAGWNKNESIRDKSTSGGIFSLLAKSIIEDNGLVVGAAFNNDFKVCHKSVSNKDDLDSLRGSKYVQSSINGAYINIEDKLRKGEKVLFSGTPCQIEGLKLFLGKEYSNLLTCGIVCHGVPSPMVFNDYLGYLEKKFDSGIKSFYFRDKVNGWKNSNVTVYFEDGSKYSVLLGKDPYTNAFQCDLYLRPVCHNCGYKMNSDILLGDFWGIEKIDPKYDDNRGTSLIIINSQKGEKYFNIISKKINYKKSKYSDALLRNPNLEESSKPHNKREEFFDNYHKHEFEELINIYMEPLISNLKNRVKRRLKKEIERFKEQINNF